MNKTFWVKVKIEKFFGSYVRDTVMLFISILVKYMFAYYITIFVIKVHSLIKVKICIIFLSLIFILKYYLSTIEYEIFFLLKKSKSKYNWLSYASFQCWRRINKSLYFFFHSTFFSFFFSSAFFYHFHNDNNDFLFCIPENIVE